MTGLLKSTIRAAARSVSSLNSRISTLWGVATLPRFANEPRRLNFVSPRRIISPEYMSIGDDCYFGPNSYFVAFTEFKTDRGLQRFTPSIKIGNRVTAAPTLQIHCVQEITISDDVLFASNVFVCDCQHGYATVDAPFKNQAYWKIAPIHIGPGCWIGQNAVIMSGVTIGDHCIVGANSVVTRSIPPRSIAVGIPARVIKQWDAKSSCWKNAVPSESETSIL